MSAPQAETPVTEFPAGIAESTAANADQAPLRDRVLSDLRRRALASVKPTLAVAASVALIAALIAALGADPATAFNALVDGALGNKFGLADTLVFGSVLALTGFAAAIPFSAGMWNIGGEGQLYAGAIAATAAAFALPESMPPLLTAGLAVAAALLAGAFWGFVPGVLRTKWGANEVIVTLMLVFVAVAFSEYTISTLWPSESHTTREIPSDAALPNILTGTSLNAGVFLALAAVAVGWFLMSRTSLGFKIRATGNNLRAAQLNGVSPATARVAAFSIGGAFAGAAGAILVLGVNQALVAGFSANFGFIGVAVALMAGLRPLWIVPAALLFSVLRAGSDNMQVVSGLDPAVGDMIVAAFVVTLLAFRVIRVRQLGSINE